MPGKARGRCDPVRDLEVGVAILGLLGGWVPVMVRTVAPSSYVEVPQPASGCLSRELGSLKRWGHEKEVTRWGLSKRERWTRVCTGRRGRKRCLQARREASGEATLRLPGPGDRKCVALESWEERGTDSPWSHQREHSPVTWLVNIVLQLWVGTAPLGDLPFCGAEDGPGPPTRETQP